MADIGLLVSGAALAVSGLSALFAWRQYRLAESRHARDYAATVVVELARSVALRGNISYALRVTNAGPAVARDVDVELVDWTIDNPRGRRIHRAHVAPALLRGEQREVSLELPQEDARFDDRSHVIEVQADYFDDNGLRNERLAHVLSANELILTPPVPPPPPPRRRLLLGRRVPGR
jgi:hypothetical protein